MVIGMNMEIWSRDHSHPKYKVDEPQEQLCIRTRWTDKDTLAAIEAEEEDVTPGKFNQFQRAFSWESKFLKYNWSFL